MGKAPATVVLATALAATSGALAGEVIGVLAHPGNPRAFLGTPPPQERRRAYHVGTIAESHATATYVYIRAVCEKGETWLAAPRQDAPVGSGIRWADGVEMRDFHSIKLNRTFAAIQFVDMIDVDPTGD